MLLGWDGSTAATAPPTLHPRAAAELGDVWVNAKERLFSIPNSPRVHSCPRSPLVAFWPVGLCTQWVLHHLEVKQEAIPAHLLPGLLCSKVEAKERAADTEKKQAKPNFPRGKKKNPTLTALKSVL